MTNLRNTAYKWACSFQIPIIENQNSKPVPIYKNNLAQKRYKYPHAKFYPFLDQFTEFRIGRI